MSREQHARHGHDDHQRGHGHHRDEDDDQDASEHDSEHQRADAGVRGHVRFGENEKADVRGRILAYQIVGGQTELLIGAGREQGVYADMTGFVTHGDMVLSELSVVSSTKNRCRVRVDLIPDQLKGIDDVLINPSSRPGGEVKQAHNYQSRVLAVQTVDGKTQIKLVGGQGQGIEGGMKGVLYDADGRRIIGFTVSYTTQRVAVADVETTISEVYRSTSAVLNPS